MIFQRTIIYPVMLKLIGRTTTGMNGYGWENVDEQNNHLFISNHRDIVLDAAFLNMLMFDKGRPTTEIAIGDNLLIYPWIEKVGATQQKLYCETGRHCAADAGSIHPPLPLHSPYGT